MGWWTKARERSAGKAQGSGRRSNGSGRSTPAPRACHPRHAGHAVTTRPSLRHARAARRLLRFHISARDRSRAESLPGLCTDGVLPPGIGRRDLGRGQQNTQPTPLHRGPVMCGGRLPRVVRLRADSRTVVRPFAGPDPQGSWPRGGVRRRRTRRRASNAPGSPGPGRYDA